MKYTWKLILFLQTRNITLQPKIYLLTLPQQCPSKVYDEWDMFHYYPFWASTWAKFASSQSTFLGDIKNKRIWTLRASRYFKTVDGIWWVSTREDLSKIPNLYLNQVFPALRMHRKTMIFWPIKQIGRRTTWNVGESKKKNLRKLSDLGQVANEFNHWLLVVFCNCSCSLFDLPKHVVNCSYI